MNLYLTNIEYKYCEGYCGKELNDVVCQYIVIMDDKEVENTATFKSYQIKSLTKSELENKLKIMELGKRNNYSYHV